MTVLELEAISGDMTREQKIRWACVAPLVLGLAPPLVFCNLAHIIDSSDWNSVLPFLLISIAPYGGLALLLPWLRVALCVSLAVFAVVMEVLVSLELYYEFFLSGDPEAGSFFYAFAPFLELAAVGIFSALLIALHFVLQVRSRRT
jgi:hypothetical protein